MTENTLPVIELITAALRTRQSLFADPDTNAYRLFNGFTEGWKALSIDRYAETAVLSWMTAKEQPNPQLLDALCRVCFENVPGITAVLLKNRYAGDDGAKKGILLRGSAPARTIREWGVEYPIDLLLNKDCGFYLDSALLRKWLLENSAGKRVLNTFAYTGSLGDAAEAGLALSVTQTDLNRNYLHPRGNSQKYLFGDFFHVAAELRRSGQLFDIIVIDPPFFAKAPRSAKVDQARNAAALVNKIRPLAAHRGKIIVVNNALFLSGSEFLAQLRTLCGDYLSLGEIIPVPEHFYGYGQINLKTLPCDPAPFNHPTKIIVLDITRKDERA